jgi:uncharacterized membrane protein YsdA (DUF1294 family)/cold shock CspA family protein
MRRAGRIANWNDDKGYGFVVPHDGGDRAFVHVNALQSGSRRPVDGDLISYSIVKDSRGRANAVNVRFAGQRIAAPRKFSRPVPRTAIGIAVLLAIVAGALLGIVPALIAIGYLALSGLSYIMYDIDKAAAGKGAQRTSESTLHAVDLLGGWPGALVAQQRLRHKTAKASFQRVFRITVLVNIALAAWLANSDFVRFLTASLFGD